METITNFEWYFRYLSEQKYILKKLGFKDVFIYYENKENENCATSFNGTYVGYNDDDIKELLTEFEHDEELKEIIQEFLNYPTDEEHCIRLSRMSHCRYNHEQTTICDMSETTYKNVEELDYLNGGFMKLYRKLAKYFAKNMYIRYLNRSKWKYMKDYDNYRGKYYIKNWKEVKRENNGSTCLDHNISSKKTIDCDDLWWFMVVKNGNNKSR